MIIKNGIVYSPISNNLIKKDIYIKNGRIVESISDKEKSQTIDAKGCYVIPGIIDSHAHVNKMFGGFGTDADSLCIPNGVMTLMDAGSLGINKIGNFIKEEIPEYVTNIKALLHVSADGQNLTTPEVLSSENIESEKIIDIYEKYCSVIKGLKIRYEKRTIQESGLSPLKTCISIAEELKNRGYMCPITVHLGDMGSEVSLYELLDMMRPGDVLAHAFQGRGETILDQHGRIKDCVKEARKKGVKFDLAHGRMSFTFQNLKQAALEGIWPDLLGTDIHAGNKHRMPAFSIMNTMTMMYALGMPMEDMFQALTYTPALIWGFQEEANTFKEQDEANISIIYKESKAFDIIDVSQNKIQIDTIFKTKAFIKKGRLLYFEECKGTSIC